MSSPSTSKATKIQKYSTQDKCKTCDKIYEKLCAMEEKSKLQHNTYCEILGEHKTLLVELTRQNKAIQSLKDIFPIKSAEGLKQLDDLLGIQPEIYVRHMKTLIASNVCKNLHEILANNVVMAYNIDGTHGKKRLKDFKNVYSRLIEAISASADEPDKKLRDAIHKEKKKSFRTPKTKTKGKENETFETSKVLSDSEQM